LIRSQHLSYKYALAVFIFFGLQGLVSNGGAIELVFSDVRFPIVFTAGRSFHLKISIYWLLIGMMGAIYFFSVKKQIGRYINVNLLILTFG